MGGWRLMTLDDVPPYSFYHMSYLSIKSLKFNHKIGIKKTNEKCGSSKEVAKN